MEYIRLGDYIRQVNTRNRDLKVAGLLKLEIESYKGTPELYQGITFEKDKTYVDD